MISGLLFDPEIQLQWTCYDLNTLATSLRGRSDIVLAKYILTIQCLSLLSVGRLVNHSKVNANCKTKIIVVEEVPRMILVAKQAISTGEELVFDYGDQDKEAIESNPWLKY